MTELDTFKGARYFGPLDGLRTVSVLLVLAFHAGDPLWRPLNGYLGVTLFFVISGFLITTLLAREEGRDGSISLKRFYVRRAFRILPLYFVALGVFTALVLAGFGSDREGYLARLPLLATLNGEFAGGGTFGHSWSLGIEEKFYLFWPVLMFLLIKASQHRILTASVMLVISCGCSLWPVSSYFAIYVPILAGALVALLLHDEKTSPLVARLARPLPASIAAVALVIAFALNDEGTYVHVGVGLVAALLVPFVVLSRGTWFRALSWRPLTWAGRRSYALYLFHPLVINAVDRVLAPDDRPAVAVARLAVITVGSFVVAEAAHRVVELPLLKLGRRVTSPAGRAARPTVEAPLT